jgi:HlyD family secretion protein
MTVRSGHEAAGEHTPARRRYIHPALTFALFGGWAACTPLDSTTGLVGHIAADSPRIEIRHMEGGIVREVLVREGEAVREGGALIRLESAKARAHADMLRKQLDAALAREARLVAELNGRPDIQFGLELLNRRGISETATILDDEQRLFVERCQFMDHERNMTETHLESTRHEIAERVRLESALAARLDALTHELSSLEPPAKKTAQLGSQYLASKEEVTRLKNELAGTVIDLERLKNQENEALARTQTLGRDFRARVAEELAEARARLSDVREKLAAASQVLGRLEIRSPTAGIVRNLRAAGAGGVIEAGETVADLVPTNWRI